MSDINRATLMGRLGKDPEIRTMQNGDKVCNFRMATSEKWRDRNSGENREKTEWHTVTIWGPLADVADRFLRKGARVLVEGKIQTRKWQDQSGNDRYSTEIVVANIGGRLSIIDFPDRDSGGRDRSDDSGSYGGAHDGGNTYGSGGSRDLDDEIPF